MEVCGFVVSKLPWQQTKKKQGMNQVVAYVYSVSLALNFSAFSKVFLLVDKLMVDKHILMGYAPMAWYIYVFSLYRTSPCLGLLGRYEIRSLDFLRWVKSKFSVIYLLEF